MGFYEPAIPRFTSRLSALSAMFFPPLLLAIALATAHLEAHPETHASKSFYILFAEQIDSPDFPHSICQNGGRGPQGGECVDGRDYDLFITSPQGNLTAAHLDKVRRAVPGSRVVAYWDFGEMPLKPAQAELCPFCKGHTMGDRPGRNCTTTYRCYDDLRDNPFVAALNAAFPPELAVRRLSPANGSCPYELVESYPGLASYLWAERSTEVLHTFLSAWLDKVGFDGIYLDGYVQPSKKAFAETGFDYDGDGLPETAEQAAALYFAWAPAFVARMRASLGADALILANSAGALSDSNLSGLTIELEACTPARGGNKSCAAALGAQHAVAQIAGHESLSILWLTHSEQMSPADQCAFAARMQAEYPWLQQGTDFFDGSHVVCNGTSTREPHRR